MIPYAPEKVRSAMVIPLYPEKVLSTMVIPLYDENVSGIMRFHCGLKRFLICIWLTPLQFYKRSDIPWLIPLQV